GVGELPLAQQATTARVPGALVSDQPRGARPRSSQPCWSWDANARQYRLQVCPVVALPRGDDAREGSPFPVARQGELRGQPSPAAPKPFITRMVEAGPATGATGMLVGARWSCPR